MPWDAEMPNIQALLESAAATSIQACCLLSKPASVVGTMEFAGLGTHCLVNCAKNIDGRNKL